MFRRDKYGSIFELSFEAIATIIARSLPNSYNECKTSEEEMS